MDMPASSASTPVGGTDREGTALLQDAEAERMAAAGQSRTRQEPSLAESSVLSSQPRFFGKNCAGSAAPGRPGADRSGGALTGLYRPAGRVLCLPEQIFPGKSRDSPQMSWLTVHFPGHQSRIRKWEHCGHGTPVQHPASVPPPEMAERSACGGSKNSREEPAGRSPENSASGNATNVPESKTGIEKRSGILYNLF